MTALVNPSSSIALGALTLIVTPALLAATVPATLKPEGMALPLGTSVDGVTLDVVLVIGDGVETLGTVGIDALLGVDEIPNGNEADDTVLEPVEVDPLKLTF
jgi:hypothetical protein